MKTADFTLPLPPGEGNFFLKETALILHLWQSVSVVRKQKEFYDFRQYIQMKYHLKFVSEYLLTAGMVFFVMGAAGVLMLSGHQHIRRIWNRFGGKSGC